MGVLLQLQKTETAILNSGDEVLFDQIMIQEGDVSYSDGVITISEPGTYIVQWTVNVLGTSTVLTSSFAIAPSNASPIIGDSPLNRNQLSGTAILQAGESGVTFSLINSLDGMVQLAIDTQITANLVVFRVNEPVLEMGPDGTWIVNGEDTHVPIQSCLNVICNGEAIGSARGIYTGVEGEDASITYSVAGKPDTEFLIPDYHLGSYATALGFSTYATGDDSFAAGTETLASGIQGASAVGYRSVASGATAHAEGRYNLASGLGSHAEGTTCTASSEATHAEGVRTVASGAYSHSQNHETIAQGFSQTAMGYNNLPLGGTGYPSASSPMLIIGNGTGSMPYNNNVRRNAFIVYYSGDVHAMGAFTPGGADYAEMFEWADGNLDKEDRVGYFVTVRDRKLYKATSKDGYILGIVSATPSIIGDNESMEWKDRFLKDEWRRPIFKDVPNLEGGLDIAPVLNPDFDPERDYVPRSQRPEWAAVGMMGKLLVRHDGTLELNGFCRPNDEGVATASEEGYFVLDVVSESIALVILK